MTRLTGTAPHLSTDPTGSSWQPVQDLLWISDATPRQGWWRALRAQHARTGLWPLLLGSLSDSDPGRPWSEDGDLDPCLIRTGPGDHDPGAVLAAWWKGVEQEEWPGLAPGGEPATDPDADADETADMILDLGVLTLPRLGLVPAARGADALAAAGWTGPMNHENDTAKISCVLRSWEERFGARVVAVGFDTLYVSVAAPPTGEEHARAVAAEHLAFCPDNIWQGAGSMDAYVEQILGAPGWTFWWD
ncbi:DUF4253 domain-containing protein [Actinoplanes utahensis]|uniref:DUF4253 domain-containing protein n=1 Tax=Actinoplanes utahensis TaxID=1869 RepID=A0A0A6UI00_ACTUT|nr:DUF4253 domain-containing protein [Actinoplanes utahensis]KHD75076.1 hypothetical protein MB27_25230 [Actinoplanes utahensis]GIF28483.1 hypothetical protein Aut01nite_14690 [Actinoplanes utahensis]